MNKDECIFKAEDVVVVIDHPNLPPELAVGQKGRVRKVRWLDTEPLGAWREMSVPRWQLALRAEPLDFFHDIEWFEKWDGCFCDGCYRVRPTPHLVYPAMPANTQIFLCDECWRKAEELARTLTELLGNPTLELRQFLKYQELESWWASI